MNPSESGAARRALDSATREVEALRSGDAIPGDPRRPILRIINAVDRSLRRILRDDPAANLEVRLKALAPDEIRIDSVLSELRRIESIPMELAAGVHELLETGRRLEGGGEPTEADRMRSVRVADALSEVVDRVAAEQPSVPLTGPRAAVPPGSSGADHAGTRAITDDPGDVTVDLAPARGTTGRRRRARRGPPLMEIVIGLVLLGVLGWAGVRYFGEQGPSEMDHARSLFESGRFTEAAELFRDYAVDHPEDVTPHLFLARIHRRLDEPELAAEAIREAERIAPGDAAVHREVGFLLLDSGQPEVAIARFSTAIELDSVSMEGWVGLARALREADRRDEIATAIATAPAEVRALLTPADTL